MAKTSTERSKDREKRLRTKGMKQLRNLWAYEADELAIREFADKRTARREKVAKRAA